MVVVHSEDAIFYACGYATYYGCHKPRAVIKAGWHALRRWWLQPFAIKEAAVADLKALNSPAVIHGPGPEHLPPVKAASQRAVTDHVLLCNDETKYLRSVHNQFCATWARVAKGRFSFAHECQDTSVNRAALFRWLHKEWKALGVKPHHIELYMADTMDLAFEETLEKVIQRGKRAQRRAARAEVYGERLVNRTIR